MLIVSAYIAPSNVVVSSTVVIFCVLVSRVAKLTSTNGEFERILKKRGCSPPKSPEPNPADERYATATST